MLLPGALKKTLAISFLGHFALFGIFSFSFGSKMPKVDFSGVSFLGQLFYSFSAIKTHGPDLFNGRGQISMLYKKTGHIAYLDKKYHLRPAFVLADQNSGKAVFTDKPVAAPDISRREPVIVFYPLLPQYFNLYFKDRQVAHIELMFNIVPSKNRSSLAVKRKVSSGNLEADLLSMRYISRYLYMQHKFFTPDKWQTVKIDLSAKND